MKLCVRPPVGNELMSPARLIRGRVRRTTQDVLSPQLGMLLDCTDLYCVCRHCKVFDFSHRQAKQKQIRCNSLRRLFFSGTREKHITKPKRMIEQMTSVTTRACSAGRWHSYRGRRRQGVWQPRKSESSCDDMSLHHWPWLCHFGVCNVISGSACRTSSARCRIPISRSR